MLQLAKELLKKAEYALKHDEDDSRMKEAIPTLRMALEKLTLTSDRQPTVKLIENKQREKKRGRVPTPPSQIPTVSSALEDCGSNGIVPEI